MTQIAADTLGLPIRDVTFELGDSSLPKAPVEGGSFTAATVGSAVKGACYAVGKKLFKLAQKMERSPFVGAKLQDVTFADGQIRLSHDPSRAVSVIALMQQAGVNSIEQEITSSPTKKQQKYARYAHSAIFAEVKVDEELGVIDVTRIVSAVAGGRILNPKTARSQVIGGVVWGIGMALEEESVIDQHFGRIMNHNLADTTFP
jgi:xanthine dehydrogenase YagR molybdenum-binding subunit